MSDPSHYIPPPPTSSSTLVLSDPDASPGDIENNTPNPNYVPGPVPDGHAVPFVPGDEYGGHGYTAGELHDYFNRPGFTDLADFGGLPIPENPSVADPVGNGINYLERFGFTPGSSGGTVTDTGSLRMQQDAIQGTLDSSLAHIADTFNRLQGELDRQKAEGLSEIEKARSQALESLTNLRSDFGSQAAVSDQAILDSVASTRGAISSDADAILRDLASQGASGAGVLESVQRGQQQAAAQGQLQGDLLSRLNQINDQYLQRNQQTTENISQGAQSDLSGSFAQLVAGISQNRADDEFAANEGARQALLELALNPPKRSVGGKKAGGVLSERETILLAEAKAAGMDEQLAFIDIISGRNPLDPIDVPEPSTGEVLSGFLSDEAVAGLFSNLDSLPPDVWRDVLLSR